MRKTKSLLAVVATLLVVGLGTAVALAASPATFELEVFNAGSVEYATIEASAPTSFAGMLLVSGVGGQKLFIDDDRQDVRLRINSGRTAQQHGDLLWTRRNVWNNDGDVARLYDLRGTLVAELAYGSARTISVARSASLKGSRVSR